MDTIKFNEELPAMECFAGDTLPEFEIYPEGGHVTSPTMVLLLEEHKVQGDVALSKQCYTHLSSSDPYFTVQLDSTDTSQLCGTYRLHFIMTEGTAQYEKLTGTLHVRQKVRAAT